MAKRKMLHFTNTAGWRGSTEPTAIPITNIVDIRAIDGMTFPSPDDRRREAKTQIIAKGDLYYYPTQTLDELLERIEAE